MSTRMNYERPCDACGALAGETCSPDCILHEYSVAVPARTSEPPMNLVALVDSALDKWPFAFAAAQKLGLAQWIVGHIWESVDFPARGEPATHEETRYQLAGLLSTMCLPAADTILAAFDVSLRVTRRASPEGGTNE